MKRITVFLYWLTLSLVVASEDVDRLIIEAKRWKKGVTQMPPSRY